MLVSFLGGLLFDLGACWDKDLDQDLDQGLTIKADLVLSLKDKQFRYPVKVTLIWRNSWDLGTTWGHDV